MSLFLHKLTNWEYWPFQVVYIPVYFQWAWYSLKARSLFFFNAANPSIKNGGFFMESKMAIYSLIPAPLYPKTIFVPANSGAAETLRQMSDHGIAFPAIAKPDVGQRGSAVKKIHNEAELLDYASKSQFDFLIQDVIPYPNEIGVFYVRYPNESRGRLTGIVSKEFVSVTGDGKSTVLALLKQNPRHAMQLGKLRRDAALDLNEVLQPFEKRDLVPYGNHVRGSKFTDASHRISAELTKTIDSICAQVPGFYFGRLDIMFESWESLEQGQNFSVVEINGAASEPTHIYDPKHSIFFGWKELTRHVKYMFEISAINRLNGTPYLSHRAGIAEYRKFLAHNRKFAKF